MKLRAAHLTISFANTIISKMSYPQKDHAVFIIKLLEQARHQSCISSQVTGSYQRTLIYLLNIAAAPPSSIQQYQQPLKEEDDTLVELENKSDYGRSTTVAESRIKRKSSPLVAAANQGGDAMQLIFHKYCTLQLATTVAPAVMAQGMKQQSNQTKK